MRGPVFQLLLSFSWAEVRKHPWRNAAAVVAVMLGVALSFSVHVINASALDEFAQAVRSVNGQADLELRSAQGSATLDESLYGRVLQHPDVAYASPVLEASTYALLPEPSTTTTPDGPKRQLLRIVGIDPLQVAAVAPDLWPQATEASGRLAMFAPDTVFLNASAQALLGNASIDLQLGLRLHRLLVAGSVAAGGGPLAVMDVAAAQDLLGKGGLLTRIDIRLRPGVDRKAFASQMQTSSSWPSNATLAEPGDAAARASNLSRAYRVNLTVLALVALFTGGFLVFSVLSLSVSRRSQQFALLAVLGLKGRERMALVLWEAACLGLFGSMLGLLLGGSLAALALQWLGGDLGGGYFSGQRPALQWTLGASAAYGALGVAAAVAGAWWPARTARALPAAQTLKGLGQTHPKDGHARIGLALLLAGGAFALLPPVAGIPLAAYVSVALLLFGGITALPWLVGLVLDGLAPRLTRHALALLAVERARRVRESAAVAVSGVVSALSLAVALTVMVASFRTSVTSWLDSVLPADLYVRTAMANGTHDTAFFDPVFVQSAQQIKGIARATTQRTLALQLDPAKPTVTLVARPLYDAVSGQLALPLVGDALPVPPGRTAIYVSEAMVDLYQAGPGQDFPPLYASFEGLAPESTGQAAPFFIAGVWRDYARQFGTIAIDQADFAKLNPDSRVNDMAFWLGEGEDAAHVKERLRTVANTLAGTPGGEAGRLLEFGSTQEIRATTLSIFDRSFAVTYWLQAVAIGIGLFGVAASFSAQVLARRKEFGLLAHLGLTRRQILTVVASEGAAWTTLGAMAGLVLGLVVSLVLVKVVNPQSFHWTMELTLPAWRLAALAIAVIVSGTVTAWLAGRAAAGRDAVLAVKEDW